MRPILILNPQTDPAFTVDTTTAVDEIDTPHALADTLRERYPDVVVRPRTVPGGESVAVWYVYRDGHWVDPEGERSDVRDRG